MAMPIWMFTTPVFVDTGGLTLGLTLNGLIDGSPYVFSSSVVAYPILPAGTYPYFIFLAKTNALLRQWILDVATALSITTRPSLANTLLKFTLPATLVPTSDTNKITVSFDSTGFAIGANELKWGTGSLDNTSGFWTKLGMVRESLTTKAQDSATSFVLTWNGVRQPSYLFVFERQGKDEGEREEIQGNTRVLRDGTVRQHRLGSSFAPRTIRLFEHESPMLGARLPVATFSAIDGTRAVLTLATTDENGLVNASFLYQNEDQITLGSYYRVGLSRHVSRMDTKSGSPKTTSATLFEKASVNAAAEMQAGMTLHRCSEFEALMWRVLEMGYLHVHEPNDTTAQTRFKGEAYALDIKDKFNAMPVRVDDFLDLWEVTLSLICRDVPELTL